MQSEVLKMGDFQYARERYTSILTETEVLRGGPGLEASGKWKRWQGTCRILSQNITWLGNPSGGFLVVVKYRKVMSLIESSSARGLFIAVITKNLDQLAWPIEYI